MVETVQYPPPGLTEVGVPLESRQFNRLHRYLIGLRCFPRLGIAVGAVESGMFARWPGLIAASVWDPLALPQTSGPMCDTPPWNLRILAVERCWEQGWTGEGVRVGHLDSGVDGNHPALLERVIEFRHFDLEGDLVPNAPVTDPNGHGTHTAGTICGGVVDHVAIGIAPGARLCSAVVIEGGKSLLRVLCGLDWLLDCQVRVLSMALGTRTYNPIFEIVLARLREQGVLPVLPIGNVGAGRTASPGNYARVVSVGAVDQMGRIARFSGSSAQKPDLLAPGVDVVSARASGGLTARDGTSMAAAHVAGVAALLIQSCPDAPIEFIERALIDTAQRQSAAERAGCVDPLAALERLRHASSQV